MPDEKAERPDDEDVYGQNADGRQWKEYEIRTEDSGDGAARADARYRVAGKDRGLDDARAQPAKEVEGGKPQMSHLIFNVCAEDPKEEHVAGYVEQAEVEKGGE